MKQSILPTIAVFMAATLILGMFAVGIVDDAAAAKKKNKVWQENNQANICQNTSASNSNSVQAKKDPTIQGKNTAKSNNLKNSCLNVGVNFNTTIGDSSSVTQINNQVNACHNTDASNSNSVIGSGDPTTIQDGNASTSNNNQNDCTNVGTNTNVVSVP